MEIFGIGAQVGIKDGLPIIVAPFDGSPADQAGVKAGDIIIEVDKEDVTSLPLNEVVNRIRGEEGTEVILTIFRPDTNESLEIPVIRGEINVPAASWAMIPGTTIALIRLNQFSANLIDEVVAAIKAAEQARATHGRVARLAARARDAARARPDGAALRLGRDAAPGRTPGRARRDPRPPSRSGSRPIGSPRWPGRWRS